MSAKSKATALLRGAQSMVAVNRKTGVIAAMPPRIQFEAPKPLEMPKSYSKTGMSLQDSVARVENAIASGNMQLSREVKRDLRRLNRLIEYQEQTLESFPQMMR